MKLTYWASGFGFALLIGLAATPIMAQAAGAASVRIAGNQPDADSLAELGATTAFAPAATLSMRAVIAPRNQAELDQLLSDLQNPSSPDYHHWLAPGEFTARFGPTPDQLAQVSAWLSSQGFTVTSASADDRMVRFTGSAAQAATAFNVRLVAAADGKHFANLDSPAIPASLAGVIQSIQGLDNLHGLLFAPQPEVQVGAKKYAFGPPDLYAFYDENTLLDDDNINGTGADCIALIEFSDFDDASVDLFAKTFGLPPLTDGTNLTRIAVGGPSAVAPGFEFETLLDIEYSHTAAPQTPIQVYIDSDESGVAAFTDPLQQAVTDDACGSISLSIFECPGEDPLLAASAETIYQQAATQNQTVFAAAGDYGSAAVIFSAKKGCVVSKKRGVIETAASPLITSVGGTEVKAKYDKTTGIVIPGSGIETVWHESIGASGGGASQVFTTKPTYQDGVTPNDGVRDIPDISLLAAAKTPGYIVGYQDEFFLGGGTSFASPYWAGIAALMEQMKGGGIDGRLGPINTQLYSLASSDAAGNGIRDVVKGNNGFNGVKGYKAVEGYDQATGWGTPDISVFAHAFTGK
jgi:subtilase family serine protease